MSSKKPISVLLIVYGLFISSYAQAQTSDLEKVKVDELNGKLIKVVYDLKNYKGENLSVSPLKEEMPEKTIFSPSPKDFTSDPALQSGSGNQKGLSDISMTAAINRNFLGIVDSHTDEDPDGTTVPDPTISVGPNHVLQMTNGTGGSHFKIWNKSGTVVMNERNLSSITGRIGRGDPITLYDHLANRFFMSEMTQFIPATNEYGLVIAISMTTDPTAGWFFYYFPFFNEIPDYPKYSIWNDAYYSSINHVGPEGIFNVSGLYAFNRTQMLAGTANPQLQRVLLPPSFKSRSVCAVGLQGNTLPPAGTGGLFAFMQDDAWTSTTSDKDSIGLFEFNVNFSSPSLSRARQISSLLAAPFKSNICEDIIPGNCITQQNDEERVLQATHQRVMNQPLYRNFGTHQGIVMTHIVDRGGEISGIRWYELRKTSANWSILQQSTYSPTTSHRWLPSLAYDAAGNIALGFNVSSATETVSIRYTGRKSCDPLNTMTYPEAIIASSSLVHNNKRYGDYNHMVADPDGNSFWFSAEYDIVGQENWSTRIAQITLDNCATTCSNSFEPNNSLSAAAAIPVNTTIISMISSASDNDFFKFNNTSSASNIRVTLSNLPADYDLELFRSGSTNVLQSSRHSGLGTESVTLNTSRISEYEVRVYSRDGAFSATSCYNLLVELSNSTFRTSGDLALGMMDETGLSLYPVPASKELNISFSANHQGDAAISLIDPKGVTILSNTFKTEEGKNTLQLSTATVPTGIYYLKVQYGEGLLSKTIVIQHE
jgi:hypothetical protein